MTEPRSKVAPAKATPAKATPPKPSKPEADAPAEAKAPPSRLSWLAGWVLVPGIIIGLIFGGGALVGAHLHDSWLARAIVWVVELFV